MLVEEVHRLFVEREWTLALAESCTGGEIGARLTRIPDASKFFLGGVVAYSNGVKEGVLGVSRDSLDRWGAVSEEVAREMAEGVARLLGADCALSVTGSAGPTGTKVGRVCFACVAPGHAVHSWQENFSGDRAAVIDQAVEAAFLHLKGLF